MNLQTTNRYTFGNLRIKNSEQFTSVYITSLGIRVILVRILFCKHYSVRSTHLRGKGGIRIRTRASDWWIQIQIRIPNTGLQILNNSFCFSLMRNSACFCRWGRWVKRWAPRTRRTLSPVWYSGSSLRSTSGTWAAPASGSIPSACCTSTPMRRPSASPSFRFFYIFVVEFEFFFIFLVQTTTVGMPSQNMIFIFFNSYTYYNFLWAIKICGQTSSLLALLEKEWNYSRMQKAHPGVSVIRIRDPWWGKIRIRDKHPRSFFRELIEIVFRVKNILWSGSEIRNLFDHGSGMEKFGSGI